MDSPLKLSGETIDVNGELRVSVTVTNTGKRSGVEVVQLDSLRDVGKISENPLIKYEWMQLKGILDFLLERRRTLHLQLKILQRKLEKEEEVLNFFSSGERSTILEFAIHQLIRKWQLNCREVS